MVFTFSTEDKIPDRKLGTHKVIGRELTEDELKEKSPKCLFHSNNEYLGRLKKLREVGGETPRTVYSLDIMKVQRVKGIGTMHILAYEDHEGLFNDVLAHDYGIKEMNIIHTGGVY